MIELKICVSVILLSLCVFVDSNTIGSSCTIKSNNGEGVCVHVKNCPSIFELFQKGLIRTNPPTVCISADRSVCCPKSEVSPMQSTTIPSVKKARISERKCLEYAQNIFKFVKVSSPVFGEPDIVKKIDNCMHKSVSLIVGGDLAKDGEFPHMAHLGYADGEPTEYSCGGSLVSPNFVLTAAHCLYPRGYGAVKFVKLDYINRNDKAVTANVAEIFEHPDYNKRKMNNDIGLLRLEKSVQLSGRILPICLPTKFYLPTKTVASGFGKTGADEESSTQLLKVTLEKFTQEECQQTFKTAVSITNDTMICYGHHTEAKDTCGGDSGGPLQYYNDEVHCTYTQIGLVSFGLKKCGTIGAAGAYANIFHYLDWIEGIVWNGET